MIEYEKSKTDLIKQIKSLNERTIDLEHEKTERIRAEKALRESEEVHRITLNSISDAVFVTDDNGSFTYICPNVEIIFGYSRPYVNAIGNIDKLLGKDLYNPNELKKLEELQNIEVEITNGVGRKHFLLVNVKRTKIKGGTILYTCHDITDRKQVVEALKKSEERLRLTLEAIGGGGWDWNVVTGHVFFSDGWLKSLGYKWKEVKPHVDFWKSIVHPRDLPTVMKKIEEHFEGKTSVYICENRLRMKSGEYRYNLDRGMVVSRDSKGKPLRMVGTDTDITERKQAENALQESEERYRALFEQAADSIVLIDAKNGSFVEFNDSAYRNLGYSRKEFQKLKVHDIEASESTKEVTQHIEKILNSGADSFETKHRTKNGEIQDIQINSRVIALHEKCYIQSIWRNITERKKLEKEILVVSEKEQQRIGQDLHDDLGQHLAGVAFMSKVLHQKLCTKSQSEAKDAEQIVKLINRGISKTRGLAKGLLPVALEAEGLESALRQLAANIENLFKVACSFKSGSNSLSHGVTIATHLYRIAQEAVNNAIKHGKAKNISIHLSNTKDRSVMKIQDDGIGIPNTLDNKKGMGLLIMDYRARMIDASLDIYDGPDGGTIVKCSIKNK